MIEHIESSGLRTLRLLGNIMVIKLDHFTDEEAGAPGSRVLWENPRLLFKQIQVQIPTLSLTAFDSLGKLLQFC